jgi:hypothetical protein
VDPFSNAEFDCNKSVRIKENIEKATNTITTFPAFSLSVLINAIISFLFKIKIAKIGVWREYKNDLNL